MTRGVLVAVVLGGLAGSARAGESPRTQSPQVRASHARDAEAVQDFRIRGPLTFDVAVRSRDGRVAIYRYDRTRRTASFVEHLKDVEVPSRTRGFQQVGDGKIVLTPEGYKKPLPPQPPGGEPQGWPLPDAERQAALEAVRGLEPAGQVLSIGQIQAATP